METQLLNSINNLQQQLNQMKFSSTFESTKISNKFSELLETFSDFTELTLQSSQNNSPREVIEDEKRFQTTASAINNNVPINPISEKSGTLLASQNLGQTYQHKSNSLLLDDPYSSRDDRPTAKEFSELTGISNSKASSLISAAVEYGHDYRNWSKIMTSSDPVKSLRDANNAVYNSDVDHSPYARSEQYLEPNEVAAVSGNFALVEGRLMKVAKDGLLLTQAGTHEDQIRSNIERFGFNSSELAPLIAKVEKFDNVLAEEMRRALG